MKFLHANKEMVDKALAAIIQLSKDSSADVRYFSRKALSKIMGHSDFHMVLSRQKSSTINDSKEVIEILRMRVCDRDHIYHLLGYLFVCFRVLVTLLRSLLLSKVF